MLLYYILASFPIILRGFLNKRKENKIYLDICFLVLLCISALRGYLVGGDLINYLPLYEKISKKSLDVILCSYDKYGICFNLFLWVCSRISSNPTFFLFCESLLILSLAFYFIKKTSNNYALSIFLFITLGFYTNTFNSVRSSFALYIASLGILYLLNDKRGKAFLFFLIAFEIHKTILPVFLLLLFRNCKLSLKSIVFLIGCSIFLSTSIGISGLAPIILLYSDSYINADDFSGGGYTLLIIDILITGFSYYLLRKKNNKTTELMLFLMVVATCLQTIAPIFNFAARISYFFLFYSIILIPNAIMLRFKGISLNIIIGIVIIIGLLYFKITVMTISMETHSNSQGTIPYYFFWEQKPKI